MQKLNFFSILCIIICLRVNQIFCASSTQTRCRYRNEEYAVDPKRPQNTCDTYGCYDQYICPGSSETGGCYCKEGFARMFKNGPCISIEHPFCACRVPPTPEDCAKRPNEIYNEYAGYRMCKNTCENYKVNCPTIRTFVPIWAPWCDCKEGYARLRNGECVPVDDERCYDLYKPSYAQCKRRGEVYRVGEMCENIPDCSHPNGYDVICLAVGPMPRCYCPEGYLRNDQGNCVPKDQC